MNSISDLLEVGFTITLIWAMEFLSDFTTPFEVAPHTPGQWRDLVGESVVDVLGEGGEWEIELANGVVIVLDEDACNIVAIVEVVQEVG